MEEHEQEEEEQEEEEEHEEQEEQEEAGRAGGRVHAACLLRRLAGERHGAAGPRPLRVPGGEGCAALRFGALVWGGGGCVILSNKHMTKQTSF